MSPETILFGEKETGVSVNSLLNGEHRSKRSDATLAATGQYFSKKTKGFLPEIIETMYAERQTLKKEMLKLKQEFEDKKSTMSLDDKYKIDKDIAHLENAQMTLKILNFVGL
jgi:DNA polymerase elongation subunit (family B)